MEKKDKRSQQPLSVDNPHSEIQERREAKLLTVPRKHHGLYRELYRIAWQGRRRKAAIRAFCLECVGYDAAGVRRCSSPECPLFEFRVTG